MTTDDNGRTDALAEVLAAARDLDDAPTFAEALAALRALQGGRGHAE